MCVNVFYTTRNKISAWSDERQRISLWTPIIKLGYFCNVISIDMTLQMWAIFIKGVYGEISHFLSDPTEILFLVDRPWGNIQNGGTQPQQWLFVRLFCKGHVFFLKKLDSRMFARYVQGRKRGNKLGKKIDYINRSQCDLLLLLIFFYFLPIWCLSTHYSF